MVGSAEQMEYKSHVVQRQLIGCALGKICKQTKNLLLVLYVIGPCLVRFKWTLIFLRSSHRIPFARAPGRVGCGCAQHRQYTYRCGCAQPRTPHLRGRYRQLVQTDMAETARHDGHLAYRCVREGSNQWRRDVIGSLAVFLI